MLPESDALEYKRQMTSTFLKTVSAFANYQDGTIVFGVDDDLNVVGVENPLQFAVNLTNSINDNLSPVPEYSIEMDEAAKTVSLHVQKGRFVPYMYKNKAYRRRNSSTFETDRLELQELILEGRNLSFDSLPASRQDLTFSALEAEAQSALEIEKIGPDTLKCLGLLKDNKYNTAAELLSDENSLPGIDVAVFGENISVIRRRERMDQMSVLEQYAKALEIFKSEYVEERISGSRRIEVERIPEEAFREALVNALMYRNWLLLSHILVRMFPDRIEIISPGGLPPGITPAQYLSDSLSALRNPGLGYVLLRLNYVEQLGTGIPRIAEAYREFEQKPDYDVSDSAVTVTLPALRHEQIDGMQGADFAQRKILQQMSLNVLYSRRELQELTGLSRDQISRQLKSLMEMGQIRVTGKARATKYTRIRTAQKN